MDNVRKTGVVRFFLVRIGWGFIESLDEDIFVHYSQIEPESEGYKKLQPGQLVEYSLIDNGRGPAAQNVKVINDVY